MIYCFALLLLSGSLIGMADYQLETQLCPDQKKRIEWGLNAVEGWKACPKATIIGWRIESWMNQILDKEISPTIIYDGQTILTQLVSGPGFGEVDFHVKQMIIRMTNSGADLNQTNATGKTPITLAITRGRGDLIDDLRWRGADLNTSADDTDPNNLIRAGLAALKTASLDILHTVYSNIWLRKECEMTMAYLIDRVPPYCITKSQIKASWKLGYKDVSRALALCRKHPEKRNEIVKNFKKQIATSLVQEFQKIDRYSRLKK